MIDKNFYVENTLKALRDSEKEKEKYKVRILGKDFIVYPGVFSPRYFNDNEFFAEEFPFKKEDFLEIGCGVGVIAVLAAVRGARVVACYINQKAIENTRENARIHRVSDKLKVIKSDIYDSIPERLRFDTIFWNIPFLYKEKDDKNLTMLEKSVFNPGYNLFKRFLHGAKSRLKENGRLILGFSSSMGNYDLIKSIVSEEGFKIRLLKRKTLRQTKKSSEDETMNIELFEIKPV
ncbi:methyltransferase [Candidatus Pacearchaeota archaeon]|nr:methyltransferase [Candidatus Pacearchaeota archaeon]MBD3283051.1 methyltransferase [Candidatus Pacearchaeota archaeon]